MIFLKLRPDSKGVVVGSILVWDASRELVGKCLFG